MKLQAITIATLVIAVIALPTPEGNNLNMKRQLGSGNNKEEGAPWKRADGAIGHGSLVKKEDNVADLKDDFAAKLAAGLKLVTADNLTGKTGSGGKA